MMMKSFLNKVKLTLTIVLLCTVTHTYAYNVVGRGGHFGAVGIVTDDSGNPMLAEYDSDGLLVSQLGYQGVGRYKGAYVMPAQDYRSLKNVYTQFINDHGEQGDGLAQGATLMPVERYTSALFTTNTLPAKNITQPALKFPDSTKSVLIIAERKMFTTNPHYNSMVLFEFPVDLTQNYTPAASSISLIMDENGRVIYESDYDVSYKSEVYKDEDVRGAGRLWAPVSTVITMSSFGANSSDTNGLYNILGKLPICPGFFYIMDTSLYADVYLSNLNPKSTKPPLRYSVIHKNYYSCASFAPPPSPMNLLNMASLLTIPAVPSGISPSGDHDIDFWVSSMQLGAIGVLQGVELSNDLTSYQSDDTPLPVQTSYNFDFDADDIATQSDRTSNSTVNGVDTVSVYLGDATQTVADFTRIADRELTPQLQDQGLLTTISIADLENTDIYIYRESNGQLVAEVEGLEPGVKTSGSVGVGGTEYDDGHIYRGVLRNETTATFGFGSLITGANSSDSRNLANDTRPRTPWKSSQSGVANFAGQKPNYLRPGELLRVIAINRATGYMGSLKVRTTTSNSIVIAQTIPMAPPNLKIIANRNFEIKDSGATNKTTPVNNIIGNEGAGLTSDKTIQVRTIWLDADGTPLPEDLPGFTGRVAVSRGGSTEAKHSGSSNIFSIQPGYNIEFVQLNNASELTTEHFYIQVVGENSAGNPDFSTPGAGEGKLATRPNKYVPVLVPIFDETSTREAERALNQAKSDGVAGSLDKVAPVYHWVYRPELQFSVYDLQRQQLQFESDDGTSQLIDLSNTNEDILGLLLADDLDYVNLLYDLVGSEYDALARFSGDSELVFAIGAEEALATVTPGGVLTFNNPEHLSLLDSADLLTIQLYMNNDSSNVLWEFEFGGAIEITSSTDTDSNENKSFIICDANAIQQNICTAQIPITAKLLFPLQHTDTVQWKVEALEGSNATDDMPVESNGGSGAGNKPFAYGKTKNWKTGKFSAVTNTPVQSGNGRFKNEWIGQMQFGTDAQYFSFEPDMTDKTGEEERYKVSHLPAVYADGSCPNGQYSDCLKGTNRSDVWRHNPHVGYKISVIINGTHTIKTIVKMDEVDVLRQEYINHKKSASLTQTSIVKIPDREKFKQASKLPGGKSNWVEVRTDKYSYAYDIVVNDGMVELSDSIFDQFASFKAGLTFTGEGMVDVIIPLDAAIRRTSSYRNPERNERVGGAPASKHMLGRAADVAVVGYNKSDTGTDKAIKFYTLWKAVLDKPPANADRVQLEPSASDPYIHYDKDAAGKWTIGYGGPGKDEVLRDSDFDGVPDYFQNSDHMHIQDNP